MKRNYRDRHLDVCKNCVHCKWAAWDRVCTFGGEPMPPTGVVAGHGVGEIKVADNVAYTALQKWAKLRKVAPEGYCDDFQMDPDAYIPGLWCMICEKLGDHTDESCPLLAEDRI